MRDAPPPPYLGKISGWTGNVDRWSIYDFTVPGVLVLDTGSAPRGKALEDGARAGVFEVRSPQALTPESETTTHYFFAQCNNFSGNRPEITDALTKQSQKLIHVSNLYYNEPQGRLAQALVKQIAPGKIFFCNSGAEANEGLFKLARRFGHEEGRFEIITTINSFHGRTLAAIAATGQEKVKKGFEPLMQEFRHVPFNDLDAMRAAISPATVAVLVEGVLPV